MPAGLATGFENTVLTADLLLGFPLREPLGTPQRRSAFIHDFDASEITALNAIITANPTVELLDDLPSDWVHA